MEKVFHVGNLNADSRATLTTRLYFSSIRPSAARSKFARAGAEYHRSTIVNTWWCKIYGLEQGQQRPELGQHRLFFGSRVRALFFFLREGPSHFCGVNCFSPIAIRQTHTLHTLPSPTHTTSTTHTHTHHQHHNGQRQTARHRLGNTRSGEVKTRNKN